MVKINAGACIMLYHRRKYMLVNLALHFASSDRIFIALDKTLDIEQTFLHLHSWRPNKLLKSEKEPGFKMLTCLK